MPLCLGDIGFSDAVLRPQLEHILAKRVCVCVGSVDGVYACAVADGILRPHQEHKYDIYR